MPFFEEGRFDNLAVTLMVTQNIAQIRFRKCSFF